MRMKAVRWRAYGPPEVLEVEELDKPVPGEREVLIRVKATTVTAGDCEMRRMDFPLYFRVPLKLWLGLRRPRQPAVPGTEFSGEIEAVGQEVTRYSIGERVFGSTGLSFGTNAEYICLSEDADMATIPEGLGFGEAAAMPFGGRDSIHFLNKAALKRGETILIIGAGGSIGTFAVQIAKERGLEVTAVDRRDKLDMLGLLGADHVVDYEREEYIQPGIQYDAVLDIVCRQSVLKTARVLKRGGWLLMANPSFLQLLRALILRTVHGKRVFSQASNGSTEDLRYLGALAKEGKLRSVIDREFSLEEIAAAHRFVETGSKKGNVVILLYVQ